MKRMMMILLFLASTAGTMSFAAGNEPVPYVTKKAFERAFPGSQFVKWQPLEEVGMYIVSFLYNTENIIAYIDETGLICASVRRVDEASLPFLVKDKLGKKYSGFEITKIEELTADGETSYMFVLENAKSKITARIFTNGHSYELRKERKKPVAEMHN